MQSIKFPCRFSFLTRRAKGRIRHRTTWVMWSVAVLFAGLAVAVLMQRTVSADGPTFDITVPMAGTTVNYETAKAQFTISNLPSTINDSNWVVGINWSTPLDSYGDSKTAVGSGVNYTPNNIFEATLSNGTITANGVALKKMIPDSEYTLKVTLYEIHSGGSWLRRGEGSTTFMTKAGCTDAGDMADNSVGLKPSWFGLYFVSHVDVNELTIVVSANNAYAPENSGRCLYYKCNEDGGGNSGILTAYFHYMNGSSRRAVIRLTGLEPGTRYHFTLSVDDALSAGNVGISGTTLGEDTGISGIDISNLTQNSAAATAKIRDASEDDKIVYMRMRTSPEGAEEEDKGFWIDQDSMSTKGSTAKFGLSSLSAGTRYEVEASVEAEYSPGKSHSVYFVTLPGQPTIDSVEEGDSQLTVEWSAPAEAPAPLTGYTVKRQDYDEYTDYDTTPPPTSTVVLHDVGADVTDYTITGLTNGKEYVIWVIAKNESYDAFGGTSSNEAYGTPMGLPGAPRNLGVAEGNAKLTLTWEAPAPQDGVTVNGYKLEWKANTVTAWDAQTGVSKADVSGLTREITHLTNGTTYDVRVRADNGVTSDSFAWATGSGTPVADPNVGSITVKERTQTSATLTVNIDNGKDTGHTVHLRYREKTTSAWTDATDQTSSNDSAEFVLGSLKAGTTYEVL
ncbi:MAG: fibronectin type III domain-containing protein, partial [Chloroflexi bacterium]|nr:fibronectin type III domain-containing protein [Chloroflexota bacterium]